MQSSNVVALPTPEPSPSRAAELVNQLIQARKAESDANKLRVHIESELIALLGVKAEGSQTHDCGMFRLTITGKLSRTIDWDAYDQVQEKIPLNLRPVKTVRALDERGVKYLQANEPELYSILAAAITVKPAKPSVEVKGA